MSLQLETIGSCYSLFYYIKKSLFSSCHSIYSLTVLPLSVHFDKLSRASSVGVLVRQVLQPRSIFCASHEITSKISEENVTYVNTVSVQFLPILFSHILLNLWPVQVQTVRGLAVSYPLQSAYLKFYGNCCAGRRWDTSVLLRKARQLELSQLASQCVPLGCPASICVSSFLGANSTLGAELGHGISGRGIRRQRMQFHRKPTFLIVSWAAELILNFRHRYWMECSPSEETFL